MIPIVYIHKGGAGYVQDVVHQAEKICGAPGVFLIGDEFNQSFCRNWFSMYEYPSELYDQLLKVYVHKSYTREEYEKFCFQRYYLLYEFMKQKGMKEAYLCDSDLLIYEDLTSLPMASYDAAFSCCKYPVYYGECASPHCSYWKLEQLYDFLLFVIDIYTNHMELVHKVYQYHFDHKVLWVSAICDMVWLTAWKQEKVRQGLRFLNMNEGMQLGQERVVWEHNLSVSDNAVRHEYRYQRSLHKKKVRFTQKKPYLILINGRKVRTLTLHCQGGKKKYIGLLTKCSNLYPAYLLVNLKDVVSRRYHK